MSTKSTKPAARGTRPAPAPTMTPTPDTAAIPPEVLDEVAEALAGYAYRAAEVRRYAALARNPLVGGGRRYVDDVRRNVSLDRDRATLCWFLHTARENGIDGLAVVRAMAARHPGTDPLAGVRERRGVER